MADLGKVHSVATHGRLCSMVGDLLQLVGEIFFDGDRYTEAAHCCALAAEAGREAGEYDLWACAPTRHAFIEMYERRFAEAVPMLEAASRVAARGDGRLSTRYWVAAVQAEAHAGLGDLDACARALGKAEQVLSLSGPVMPGGWLRFDGSRPAEGRGTCYRELGQVGRAEAALADALDEAPSLRRRGGILTDLAMLGVQRRDLDQALEYGGQAVDLAERTRSSGYVGRRLDGLRAQLAPHLADSRVPLLGDRISRP